MQLISLVLNLTLLQSVFCQNFGVKRKIKKFRKNPAEVRISVEK